MNFKRIIWKEEIVEKLARKHGVSQDEVEEALLGQPIIRFAEAGLWKGEDLYTALGRTEAGRLLIIFFIRKPDEEALIISAREMTKREKRHYAKRKKG